MFQRAEDSLTIPASLTEFYEGKSAAVDRTPSIEDTPETFSGTADSGEGKSRRSYRGHVQRSRVFASRSLRNAFCAHGTLPDRRSGELNITISRAIVTLVSFLRLVRYSLLPLVDYSVSFPFKRSKFFSAGKKRVGNQDFGGLCFVLMGGL